MHHVQTQRRLVARTDSRKNGVRSRIHIVTRPSVTTSITISPEEEGDSIHISDTRTKKHHNRSNVYHRRGIIIDRVSIDKHPKIVEKKNRIGDFDLLIQE